MVWERDSLTVHGIHHDLFVRVVRADEINYAVVCNSLGVVGVFQYDPPSGGFDRVSEWPPDLIGALAPVWTQFEPPPPRQRRRG